MSPAVARIKSSISDANVEPILIPGVAADGALYPLEKMAAHREGLLHLAVSVFVFSGDELLIQRRAQGKYHCGGLWANTCCTHPHWNETPHDSAARRLMEEVGVSLPLVQTALIEYAADVTDNLRECERVYVYRADADKNMLSLRTDAAEIEEMRWVSIEALKVDARRRPHLYAPWFRIYLTRWDELGL